MRWRAPRNVSSSASRSGLPRDGTVKRRVAPQALAAHEGARPHLPDALVGRSLAAVCKELGTYLAGWKAYFRIAETPRVLADIDKWIRHRLRALQLKHWKRGPTIYRELRARGMSDRRRQASRRQQPPVVAQLGDGSSTSRCRTRSSTSWEFPGLPRDLNPSNRPVRTRMPGGVAGAAEANTSAPLCRSELHSDCPHHPSGVEIP